MSRRRVLAVIGLALLAAGLTVGLLPRSAQGVTCGSVFVGRGNAFVSDLLGETRGAEAQCADERAAARLPAVGLLVGGAALLIGAAVVGAPGRTTPR
jgi:hypothetical protein